MSKDVKQDGIIIHNHRKLKRMRSYLRHSMCKFVGFTSSVRIETINKGFYDEESWKEVECLSCGKTWQKDV